MLSAHPVFCFSFLFYSYSCLFSLLHYCFLCILIFTNCQSNDKMPEMRKVKNESKRTNKNMCHLLHWKETCVVTILNDMLMEYKIWIRGSDAFNFTWKVHGLWILVELLTTTGEIFFTKKNLHILRICLGMLITSIHIYIYYKMWL